MTAARRVRFGSFELDLESADLTKDGNPVRIEPQPLKVLMLLAERAGGVVSRKEIQAQTWSDDTFVDFDQGLNYCIRQIRAALGDSAESPQFIETLPRRGYRFVAEVQPVAGERPVTLAVLPFRPIHGERQDEWLELGIADAVITRLSTTPSVLVRPMSTVRLYDNLRHDSIAVARAVKADLVLEGSVLRVGQRVRSTARLLDASTGLAVWAGLFSEHAADMLAVLDAVSSDIAQQVLERLNRSAVDKPLERIVTLTRDWTAEQFERSYAEGKWTARQLLIHLAQTEIGLGYRARMVLTRRDYTAQPFDQDAWVARENSLSGRAALDALVGLHTMNRALFASLSPAERTTAFEHPDFGTLTFDWIVQLLDSHLAHHVTHIERIAGVHQE